MSTVKVKLLNDGGYGDSVNVEFPVVVCGVKCINGLGELYGIDINIRDLNNIGFNHRGFEDYEMLFFSTGDRECEIVEDDKPTKTDMVYMGEVEQQHDITNKCCNQFGERDEMQQIINSLQADVIARGARIAELERKCNELYKLAEDNGVCSEFLKVNFACSWGGHE